MEEAKIQVEVRVYSILREVFGASSNLIETEEEGTLAALITQLGER